MKSILKSLPAILASVIVVVGITYAAGSLTAPSGTPSATSYTLGDIYNKLVDFTYGQSDGNHDLSTASDPASTFASLDDIFTLLVSENTDLVASNIAVGIGLFGVSGTLYGDTDPSKVLNNAMYPGTAIPSTFPTQWSSDDPTGYVNWSTAMAYCANLTEGDASPGDWHLPTYTELVNAYITSQSGFQAFDNYWSSTEYPNDTNFVYGVYMFEGGLSSHLLKTNLVGYARCAR